MKSLLIIAGICYALAAPCQRPDSLPTPECELYHRKQITEKMFREMIQETITKLWPSGVPDSFRFDRRNMRYLTENFDTIRFANRHKTDSLDICGLLTLYKLSNTIGFYEMSEVRDTLLRDFSAILYLRQQEIMKRTGSWPSPGQGLYSEKYQIGIGGVILPEHSRHYIITDRE